MAGILANCPSKQNTRPNVVSNKIIVSNKLLGLLRIGLGFEYA